MSVLDSTSVDGDRDDFTNSADIYRRELLAHCYRMVGSLHEAEDLVQETYVRAWRAWPSFEGRSSVRTWLYRIATNVCLTLRQHHQRRILPSGLGAPGLDEAGTEGVLWLDPFPDALAGTGDPAEVVAARVGLRLALMASLQLLPARQRAVFLLREAHGFPATEIAELLDMSVPAVKSALQRARVTMQKAGPVEDSLSSASSAEAEAVLDRYMEAFESADIDAMVDLLGPTRCWPSCRRGSTSPGRPPASRTWPATSSPARASTGCSRRPPTASPPSWPTRAMTRPSRSSPSASRS